MGRSPLFCRMVSDSNNFELAEVLSLGRERKWLITGVAGFIGSNILEFLLRNGCQVTGLDNLETGYLENLDSVRAAVGEDAWKRFALVSGDIRDFDTCLMACEKADVVIHLAALGSVPSSLLHPNRTTDSNVGGFVNMLTAAKDTGVSRFVYASSCSVYGDAAALPLREEELPRPLSPYALSKLTNEHYAAMFGLSFGLETVGLRFFNVYGPRQDAGAAYAAVIPIWFDSMLKGRPILVNGDGESSRDFCHVRDVAQACVRAGVVREPQALNRVYNIGSGRQTSLNELIVKIREAGRTLLPEREWRPDVRYRDFREGDIRHSLADISLARARLGFQPAVSMEEGLLTVAGSLLVPLPVKASPSRILLVARGSRQDGLGHFMRTRAVAEALLAEGAEILVLLRGDESGIALFQHSGIPHRFCGTDEQALASISEWAPGLTVFDTLTFSPEVFAEVAERSRTASLSPVFNCLERVEVLFHRTVHEDPRWREAERFPRIVKGLEYTIVSERCHHIPRPLYQQQLRQNPLSIAISMGGADAPNRTLAILESLARIDRSFLIWVLLGEAYTHSYEELVSVVRGSRHEVILVKSNESMWRILHGCSLIICSGGMTTYEAAYAGLPSLNLPPEPGRYYLLEELEARGAGRVVMGGNEALPAAMELLEHWEGHREELLAMHDAASVSIPPQGARRVARELMALVPRAPVSSSGE